MGSKRPFDIEEFHGLPLKQARSPYGEKMNYFVNTVPCDGSPQKPGVLGGGGNDGSLTRCGGHKQFDNIGVSPVPTLTKDIDSNAPLTLVFSSSNVEDVVFGEAECSLFPQYFEYDFPRKIMAPFLDVDTPHWDRFPRKQVSIGPNFQASIPPLSRNIMKKGSEQIDTSKLNDCLLFDSNCHMDDEEKRLLGTCIIPMPEVESFADEFYNVGHGRTDCGCLDADSVRCVRQHIMETRENLRKSIGHDNFVDLGFYDMGEDVACRWSEEEERVFRSVVYSNPASLGHNFWKHLPKFFPTRSIKEIVSYYFNVFILRRRASQNRSNLLDIDSDDDEWHGIKQSSKVLEQEEDSGVESPVDRSGEVEKTGDILADDEHDEANEGDDDSSDDSDGDQGGEIDDNEDATGGDSGVEYGLEGFDVFSYDMSKHDTVAKDADCKMGVLEDDFAVQEDSCMSFEFQIDKLDTCSPLDAGASFQLSGNNYVHGINTPGGLNGDLDGQIFLLDSCDSKLWDARFGTNINGIDLLPTCNLIEEFFGQGTM